MGSTIHVGDHPQVSTAEKAAGTETALRGFSPADVHDMSIGVQFAFAQSQAAGSTGVAIPNDNTIPQNTEGAEWETLAITPKDAGNDLDIQFNAVFDGSTTNNLCVALFVDSTADAIAVASVIIVATNRRHSVKLRHIVSV